MTITAYNKYGHSPASPVLTLIAAQEPSAVSSVTVQITGNSITASWPTPFDNFATIKGYYVFVVSNNLENNEQEFVDATAYCSEASEIPADIYGLPNVKGN